MWTPENRPLYNRDHLRYPSDLTEAEWKLVSPLLPPAKHGGRRRSVDLREVDNGVMYVVGTGCQCTRPVSAALCSEVGSWESLRKRDSANANEWQT